MKHADMDTIHLQCIHFPFRFGPLINHWTTRFEAKHKYFKNLANVMGNYTNICYSLALRHQLQHCYLSLNNETLPGEENEVGPGDIYIYMHVVMMYTCTYLLLHVRALVIPLYGAYMHVARSLTEIGCSIVHFSYTCIYRQNDSLPRKYNLGIFIHNILSKQGLQVI